MKTCFNSHFYAILHEFSKRAIKSTNVLQLYTDYMVLIHLEWRSSSFLHQISPNAFFPKFKRPLAPISER